MTTITKVFRIDAGHRLMNHESKCRNVHGHSYTFEVTVRAMSKTLDGVGRVIDFGVLKAEVGGWLDAAWDHGFIVERGDPLELLLQTVGLDHKRTIVLDCPPSIENLVRIVFDKAAELMGAHAIKVVHVRGYETPTCFADYDGLE
jgi:6-pyruvoyltetrahydropterin/6-carboxytetrahydropterin synthase